MQPIPLEALNAADRDAFVAALGDVMEHSPWVAESAYAVRPFSGLTALYQAMVDAVRNASDARKLDLIKKHPELAGKVAREGALGADSAAEQESVGLNRLTDEEFATFHRLNDAYGAKFGIPFIVCVRRHTKDSILREFARRLENDAAAERDAALNEIFRIAALRLDQRVEAPDRLKVTGQLSTHVLDTHGGRPAAGVAIELWEIAASGSGRLLVHGLTNNDGRTDKPLISGKPIPIAVYELRFGVGDYFRRQRVVVSEPPFLGVVPVRFAVAEPEIHYHVPLLVTPWSYATYRGS
jgi:2-oxo-4-hydroxy-4-carboxy-5-ureidoimidazoline decarboxylase